MRLIFADRAWEEYLHWQATDRATLKRVDRLIKSIRRTPFEGPGDPEPLRGNWSGYWSRRIDREHRLVYSIEGEAVFIAQCRFHY